jgi:hypothetical protein
MSSWMERVRGPEAAGETLAGRDFRLSRFGTFGIVRGAEGKLARRQAGSPPQYAEYSTHFDQDHDVVVGPRVALVPSVQCRVLYSTGCIRPEWAG